MASRCFHSGWDAKWQHCVIITTTISIIMSTNNVGVVVIITTTVLFRSVFIPLIIITILLVFTTILLLTRMVIMLWWCRLGARLVVRIRHGPQMYIIRVTKPTNYSQRTSYSYNVKFGQWTTATPTTTKTNRSKLDKSFFFEKLPFRDLFWSSFAMNPWSVWRLLD